MRLVTAFQGPVVLRIFCETHLSLALGVCCAPERASINAPTHTLVVVAVRGPPDTRAPLCAFLFKNQYTLLFQSLEGFLLGNILDDCLPFALRRLPAAGLGGTFVSFTLPVACTAACCTTHRGGCRVVLIGADLVF